MKPTPKLLLLPLAVWLVGCAVSPSPLVLEPVGPAPAPPVARMPQGTLIVYSAFDSGAPGTRDFRDVKIHTDYKIYAATGQLWRVVRNHPNFGESEPAHVVLPVGGYRVVAESNGSGVVTVPVAIAANQATIVHLEGGGSWQNDANFNTGNAVRLPNGEIIGYRAPAGLAP